ncbi:MAG: hypothetical protein WC449_00330 [Candidatus Paceibacterota bacterium]
MDKNYILQLTLGLYKVTELFPEREPLRYKIREKANDIYAGIATSNFCENRNNCEVILNDLGVLNAFLELARMHNWANERNFVVLSQGYLALEQDIQKKLLEDKIVKGTKAYVMSAKPVTDNQPMSHIQSVGRSIPIKDKVVKKKETPKKKSDSSLSGAKKANGNITRKSDIQKILSQKGPMRLVQLVNNFSAVNKRTLRRDVARLVEENVLERYDVGKLTFYKIKSV